MASNRIKGLTIEIDGDVTKLDKALSSVDKQLYSTQNKLKDVTRLLKFDPTNVELLNQKQRLLSQTVEQTSKRYDTLKKTLADSSVNDSAAEKWSKEQAIYQAQITKTENSLKKLNSERDKLLKSENPLESNSDAYKAIQSEINETSAKLDELKINATAAYEELGKPISTEQYDALQRELVETQNELKNAQKAASGFNPTLERFSASMEGVSEKTGEFSNKTKILSAAAAGVAGALVGAAVKAGQYADEINTLSKQSGFSVETIQSWKYAADRIDVDVNTIISAATKMTRNITSTSSEVQAAWEKLGVSLTDSVTGDLRDVQDIFNDTVSALSNITNETERDIVAMTIFGKGANELAGIVDDGGESLRFFTKQAEDAGLIMSGEALDGANAFSDGLDTVKAKAEAAFLSAGASLAEKLLPSLDHLVEIVGSVLEWFSQLDGGTLKLIFTITALVAIISPIAKIISNVTGAISGVSKVAQLFSSGAGNSMYLTFAKWALIIVAVTAAITALIAAIAALTGKGAELRSTFDSLGSLSGLNNRRGGHGSRQVGIPAYADGGVVAPNNPMLAVVGDNRTEREIIAPESLVRGAVADALAANGGAGGSVVINATFTASDDQLVRVLAPQLDAYYARRGAVL